MTCPPFLRPLTALLFLAACGGSSAPQVLAQNESAPVALAAAADGSALFWIDDSDSPTGATVRRLALSGAAQPTTIATGFGAPKALAVDGATVYWLSGDGHLRSVAAAGGTPAILATEPAGYTPFALVAQGGALYWLSTQAQGVDANGNPTGNAVLASLSLSSGAQRKELQQMPAFADANTPTLLATDGSGVFWAQADGNIGTLDAAGKASFVARRQGQLSALAVAGGNAYWIQNINGTAVLIRQRLGALPAPALVASMPLTVALVGDAGFIYAAGPTTAAVSRVSVSDGALGTLVSDPQGANALALGPGALYVISISAGGEGRILRVAR